MEMQWSLQTGTANFLYQLDNIYFLSHSHWYCIFLLKRNKLQDSYSFMPTVELASLSLAINASNFDSLCRGRFLDTIGQDPSPTGDMLWSFSFPHWCKVYSIDSSQASGNFLKVFFSFLFFLRQKTKRPAPKHKRQLTTWQVFYQVERRFYSQESNRHPLPWDLDISPPSSSSLGFEAQTSIYVTCDQFSPFIGPYNSLPIHKELWFTMPTKKFDLGGGVLVPPKLI